jgi:DNA-binding transcriptional LysR family regulator
VIDSRTGIEMLLADATRTGGPRAEQFARPVRRALDELQLALEPDLFSPATAERSFVVALNNFGAIALAAPLVSECLKHAPRIRLSLRPGGTLDLLNLLERAELDLVISALDAPPIASQPKLWSSITMSS